MLSRLQISPENTCPLAPLIYQGLFCLFYMRQWDERPMEVVFMQLPMSPGSQTPTVQDVATLPIFMFPYSSSMPQALPYNTHLFGRCTPSDTRKHVVRVSRCFLRHYLTTVRNNTHKEIATSWRRQTGAKSSFPSSYIPGHNFLFLRLREEKYQNDLKTPLHSKSPPCLLHSTLQPPYKMAEECKWNSSWSMGTDARRGHTHQSVHSLHRTPALQVAHSSCSC